ncbi:MAG: UDP-2,3-diacylglucosamine diphosphatase LpxI [Pseudomonadota bacterium]
MLALISGRGSLPSHVASAQPVPPLICVLDGFAPNDLLADITFRLEKLGSLLGDLKERGVTEVCFCGAISRPEFKPTALDRATLPLLPVMMKAIGSGDDAALRSVIRIFEQRGFLVRAAHELAPNLLAPAGILSKVRPDTRMREAVERADAVLEALGPLDVGQGCVVGAGQVWGIESIGGTDHMLNTLPDGVDRADAVLVKAPKPGQDLRADLPTVGPDTIDRLVASGLKGLALRAGQVMMLDRALMISKADAARIAIWVRETG